MLGVILYNGDKVIVYKYHGCGNSFLIVNGEECFDYAKLAQRLCNAQDGLGADGLLAVNQNPLTMRIFNKDGSEAKMCGNGIRCFVHYCFNQRLIEGEVVKVSTKAGLIEVKIISTNPFVCDVNLGKPIISEESPKPIVLIDKKPLELQSLWLGTEHGVVLVDGFSELESKAVIEEFLKATPFLNGTNVNFLIMLDSEHALVKTFERGVGWTPSCGTGAGASFIVAKRTGKCGQVLRILNPFGFLIVYEDAKGRVHLVGPSQRIAKIWVKKILEK